MAAAAIPLISLVGGLVVSSMMGGAETPAPPPPPPPPPEPPTPDDANVQNAIDEEQRKRMAADSVSDQNKTKGALNKTDPLAINTNVNKKQSLLGSAVDIQGG